MHILQPNMETTPTVTLKHDIPIPTRSPFPAWGTELHVTQAPHLRVLPAQGHQAAIPQGLLISLESCHRTSTQSRKHHSSGMYLGDTSPPHHPGRLCPRPLFPFVPEETCSLPVLSPLPRTPNRTLHKMQMSCGLQAADCLCRQESLR